MGGVYSFPYPENKWNGTECEIFYDNLRDNLPVEPLKLNYENRYKDTLDTIRNSILKKYENDKDIKENIDKNIKFIFTNDIISSPLHKLLEWLYTISNSDGGVFDKRHTYNYRFSIPNSSHPDDYKDTIKYIINNAYENDKDNLLYSWKGENQFNGVKTVVCFLFILNKIFTCNKKNAGICNEMYITQKLVDKKYRIPSGNEDGYLDIPSHSSTTAIPTIPSDFLTESTYNGGNEKYNGICCHAFLIIVIILFLLYLIIDKPIFLICIILVLMIYMHNVV